MSKKATKLAEQKPTVRQDFNEVIETLWQGLAIVKVTIPSLDEKDENGADVGNEIQALRAAVTCLNTADSLLGSVLMRLAHEGSPPVDFTEARSHMREPS